MRRRSGRPTGAEQRRDSLPEHIPIRSGFDRDELSAASNLAYNYRRPHRALDRQPPIRRLAERNNLTGPTPRAG